MIWDPAGGAQDEEAFFHKVFDHMPFPSIVLNPAMVVEAVNQAFLKRYRFERTEVLGRRCHQLFHDSDQPCPAERCRFQEALAGATDCYNMHEYKNRFGEDVLEEVLLTPLKDKDGNIRAIIESIRDVTQAKRLQSTLVETNEFLNRILDSMVGVVIAADLEHKILFVNQSVKRVLGYEISEVVGQTLWKICDDQELSRINHILEENQGRALMVHTQVRKKDGEKIPVRVNSSYVYLDEKPVAMVAIFTDLRDQLRIKDSLARARMQLVQSDKLAGLGRMAAGLAHELNNPLTGIIVFADLLKEQFEPGDPAHQDLSGIVEDAERCQQIVKGMLDYSRQGEVKVQDLDLNQIIEEAFNLIRDNAVFLKVKVIKKFSPEPLSVQGDAKLLRQVFINLFMNAVDAMAGEGELIITTGLDEGGWRYAEVSDTGPGISGDNLRKVFDPFFTTKTVGKGTGLGLSVVYGVLERHGGDVTVKQTGPKGTTFLVRLPAKAPQDFIDLARTYDPYLSDPKEES